MKKQCPYCHQFIQVNDEYSRLLATHDRTRLTRDVCDGSYPMPLPQLGLYDMYVYHKEDK